MAQRSGSLPPAAAPAELPERRFGWWDMFVNPEEDPREEGDSPEGERETLIRYLRDRRLTLEIKCAGLDADAMAARSVPPSNLSLLGLVRHLAGVERYWFRKVIAGQDVPRLHGASDSPDGDFEGAVPDREAVAQAWADWRAEVTFAEHFVEEAADLGMRGSYDHGDADRGTVSLRQVLVHMIEEYARHLGHADFLRERIDGRVGQ
jgi:uncharacterized damage-inducible protein DinB